MKKTLAMKSIKSLLLIIFIIITTFIMFFVPTSFAFADTLTANNLSIEYEGNVKIISNIDNYLSSTSMKTRSTKNTKIDDILSQIGYPEDRDLLNEEFIESVANAKKIYSLSQTFSVDAQDSVISNPVSVSRKNCTVTLNVIDEGKLLNGRKTFLITSTVKWDGSHPTWRMKDILAFAWTDQALGTGSEQLNYYMQYDKSYYNTQGIWEKTVSNVRASSNKMVEIMKSNGAGIKYDLPEDKTILPSPKYTHSNIFLFASTRVTAIGDFVVHANYGHQILAGNPSFSINTEKVADVSISFNYVMDEFYPGSIRVYLNN